MKLQKRKKRKRQRLVSHKFSKHPLQNSIKNFPFISSSKTRYWLSIFRILKLKLSKFLLSCRLSLLSTFPSNTSTISNSPNALVALFLPPHFTSWTCLFIQRIISFTILGPNSLLTPLSSKWRSSGVHRNNSGGGNSSTGAGKPEVTFLEMTPSAAEAASAAAGAGGDREISSQSSFLQRLKAARNKRNSRALDDDAGNVTRYPRSNGGEKQSRNRGGRG